MKSYTTSRFRQTYQQLPVHVQLAADRAFKLFQQNPAHPGLHFKKVDGPDSIDSARVGIGYRVLGQLEDDEIVWFWIGTHSEYDKFLSNRGHQATAKCLGSTSPIESS